MKFPSFGYACPGTLEEAVALLAAHPGEARPLAGGQSLMPLLAYRMTAPRLLVDLQRLPLRDIAIDGAGTRIGALVRWCDIETSTALREAQPLLVEAVSHVAHYQIRNRGTIGGSLCHADPAAEMPGIAVTCDAVIEAIGPHGPRSIAADDFLAAPLTTTLAPDEILVAVRFPRWTPGRRWGFQEFARRQGDFALAGVAVMFDIDSGGRAAGVHIGAIGVGDRAVRLSAAEAALEGRHPDPQVIAAAAAAAEASVHPRGDIHGSADYRRSLVGALCERAIEQAMAGQR